MRRFHLLLPIVTLATLAAAGCDGGIGTGGTVAMEVKPLSLTFDATSVGGHSSMTVTVKSIGEKTLTVTGIVLDVAEGDAEQLYLIEPPATPFDLEEGHAQAIELEFAPIAGAEPPRGTLTITSNDESNPTAVVQIDTPERTGKMKLIPDNLEWGNVQMHQGDPPGCAAPPSMVKEFEVTNIGQALLQVTGWDLSPEGELEHFTICPADYASGLPVGASREWKVVFHPFDTDRHVASLFVQHTLGQKEVKLRGGGEGGKCIDLVPEVLAWPNLPQDECGEQNLVIANCGTMPLAIREFKFEPRHLDDFYDLSGDTFDRERYNLRGTIPRASQDDAGEATVHVKYCAEPEIPMTGELLIFHSASPNQPSPLHVELRGNQAAPQLSYSPSTVQINGTEPGTSSVEFPVVLSNVGGAALVVSVSEITPFQEAQGHDNFLLPRGGLQDLQIESGQFETLLVQYARPNDQVGTDFGCLSVEHNDPFQDSPVCVQLIASHPANLPPVAHIEVSAESPVPPVPAGTEVCLDGSTSTDEGDPGEPTDICRYEWLLIQRPPGSSARVDPISSETRGDTPASPLTCLTADVPGEYVVTLTVTECGAAALKSPPARHALLANPAGG